MIEPHTHPLPKTLSSHEASELARSLWEEIRDVCATEQALEIIERHLDVIRELRGIK